MNISKIRGLLAAVCVVSILAGFTKISAGPVRFDQVVQIVNARPGASQSGTFSRLRLANDNIFLVSDDDEDKTKIKVTPPQDDRVIIETRTDIVTDDVCDCEEVDVVRRGFPKWALLGLVAIPIAFIWIRRKKTPTPTPTPSITPTPGITPTPTPTPTPGITPTPTPTPDITPTPTPTPGITPTPTPTPDITPTPTPTPGITPTPTPTPDVTPTPTPTPKITPTPTPMITPTPTPPEPVPEPMTILLFGTGLASVGLAARRKFRKKKGEDIENDED